jgi:hypothetical protein
VGGLNPWHDVPLGDDPETEFQSVAEIPRGSKNETQRGAREAVALYRAKFGGR